ncbi:MAG: zinc-dependent metalloprotease [Polyangiaceae bacterium]|nr:zinc-dependent metalloprotease [Polyangiaceae bacterium]
MDRDYQQAMNGILMNENPLGAAPLYSRQGIENQLKFNEKMRVWRKNHDKLATHREILLGLNNIYTARDADVFSALSKGARRCKNGYFESDSDYRERIIEAVVFNVALHEFGHTLSLRHNFYGSVDAKHMEQGDMSSSIMDYVRSQYEASTPRNWGSYDRAALKWIYGGQDKREEIMKEDFLYCTDEHRSRSALCYAHDLGVTPSQIMLNAIEQYDFSYRYRNRRAYRTFWDTSSYVGAIYNDTFSPLRMWYLGLFDWAGGGVQDILKRLDQTDPSRTVLTSQQYDEIATDFYNDISAAIGMNIAFYDAIVNQAASTRNYQTEFDPYYGDVLRLGIIIDKLYATYAFMDLQDVYNYSPNVATYVAMYDAPFGDKNAALAQRVLDNMLGSNYDTFPWFRYTAVGLFASATNSNLVDTVALRDRIAIQRFENQMEFELRYGADTLAEADRPDNPAGLFSHKGEQYVHSFLPDQSWHLVASKSRSPVSYQFMKDYNEAVRGEASASEDTYGLKILLAYYEYFNNFVGF